MDDKPKKIAIAVFQYSVVVKGIEKKLNDIGYEVSIMDGDFERIREHAGDTDVFIAYLPTDLLDDSVKIKTLTNICEMINSAGAKMILIGEAKYHRDLLTFVPVIKGFEWLDRPVEMDVLRPMIEKTISGTGTSEGKKRILIVDDDPSYAKMVREWIKSDYRVDIVTAGMQAISFLLKVPENEKIDLILLDYEMPVVDGPQVFQMLKQDPATDRIPVIFLTGLGTKEAVERVMALKPDGYVLKSTTRADLLKYLSGKLS